MTKEFIKGMNILGIKLASICAVLCTIGINLPSSPYTLTLALIANGLGVLGVACMLTATAGLLKTILRVAP